MSLDRWLMDPRIKARIEKIVQELIETRGATQEEIRHFFANDKLHRRMLAGFDELFPRGKTPVLCEDAQTD